MTDAAPEPSTRRRSGEPGCSRWSWPTTSSRVAGRIRTASGADAPTGPAAPPVEVGSPGTSNRPSDTLSAYHGYDAGCVTKSISSSTRPMSAGSRSFQSRTRPRIRCHALAMSACLRVRPAERAGTRRSSSRRPAGRPATPRCRAAPGLTACQMSMNGWPTTSVCVATRARGARRRRCGPPWTRRRDGRRARPAGVPGRAELLDDRGQIVDAAEVFDDHALDRAGRHPTPARRVRRRAGPRRRCGWPARPSPSHRAPPPSRTRCGPRLGAARRGAVRITGLPSIRYPGPIGNGLRAAAPVLEFHSAVLDPDDRTHVTGLRVLDDHADLDRLLGGAGFACAGCWRGHRSHSDQPPGDRRVTPVLLNRDTAEGIANGTITLVLRRWDAPRAKPGGTQRTIGGHHPHRRRHRVPRRLPRDRRAGARRGLSRRQIRAEPTWTAGPPSTPTSIAVSFLAPDERPDLAADDRLSDCRRRRDQRAAGPLGRGATDAVDPAVPGADRRQRGGPRSRPRRPRRPGRAAVQAPGAPAQGPRPDHQPRRRLPNFTARPGISAPHRRARSSV